MQILSNTLSFVVALGIIIFVHELGHLLVAKAFGVRVLTFSLGFGRRIWGFRRGDTDYRVALIPLGGYVRLGGENPEETTGDPREFLAHPRWQRILVYLAGPAMNVVLAVVLIAVVFMVGLELPFLQDIPAVVGAVEADSPAARAGIRAGDQVVAVAGEPIDRWQDVAMAIVEAPDRPVALTVERDGRRYGVQVVPERVAKYEFGDAGMYPRVLPRISSVAPEGAAAAAGFAVGDEVRSVEGRPLGSPADFVRHIESSLGREVRVDVLRQGQVVALHVTPRDEGGKGRIGVGLTISQRFGPLEAFRRSLSYNWDIAEQTIGLLGKLVRRKVEAKSALHGPIEIAALSGEAARQGVVTLLHLMGLISMSIALLNLLPIPVLDGGQITLLLFESALRRDVSIRWKELINLAGLAFIVALMLVVLAFDLRRNLPESLWPGAAEPPTDAPVEAVP